MGAREILCIETFDPLVNDEVVSWDGGGNSRPSSPAQAAAEGWRLLAPPAQPQVEVDDEDEDEDPEGTQVLWSWWFERAANGV